MAEPDLPIDTITPLEPLPENISVEPKLIKGVSRWGQREPFNSALPYLPSGRQASVGCAVLAVAMYMSYHETPGSYAGRNLNWKMMKIWPESADLAYFLYILGDENNLNLTYQENGTGTFPLEYVYERTFTNCGYPYSSPSPLSNFNFSSKFMVNLQLPMILRGDSMEGDVIGGHVWITDGLLHIQDRDMFNSKEVIDKFYLHCVWGWYGRGNGYFKFDKLNRIGGNRDGGNDTGTYAGYNDFDEVPEFSRANGLWGIRPGGQMIRPDF